MTELLDRNIVLSLPQLLWSMVRKHQVEHLACVDRVGDDVSILCHPHFHGELLNELLGDWVFVDLIVRYDGTIGAVGGGRLRGNVREQRPSGDAVDAVGSDQQVE
jgi:hypothetical protein